MRESPVQIQEKKGFFQRKAVKRLLIAAAVFLILLLLVLLAGYWFVSKSHPDLDGETIAAPVTSEVDVIRDDRGVAKIEAENLEDLFYTQGYVMAQDRLFQMDMTRRLAGGELAEVVGEEALESDEYFRTYGMHRSTEALTEEFDEETTAMVDAFASGVTAYIDEAFAEGEQPLEFRILGYKPDPWTPEDTAIAVKYMGYTLTGNFREEVENYELVRTLGQEAVELFPDYTNFSDFPIIMEENAPALSEAGSRIDAAGHEDAPLQLEELTALFDFMPETWNGSNNWAISGEHTESGFPMIGDDPHLGLAIPSVWYQTHLELEDDFHSVGVTVPGIPGVVLGHNGSVSWGVTSMSADYEDLFLERVNPDNPNEYLYDEEWEEAERIDEEIYIDGEEEPHMHRVEITRNGPIMNKFVEEGPYQAVALKWSGLEAGEELNGILRLNRSENAEEFLEGLDGFVTPGLSWVFADTDNNIGYRGQGLLPIRGSSDGTFPVPGWDPDYQWQGFIPSEELPTIMNPDSGYILTANNMPAAEDYEYEIGRSFFPYRALRLEEMLEDQIAEGTPFTLEDMADQQTDLKNTQAERLLPILIDAVEAWNPQEEAVNAEGEVLEALDDTEQEALAALKDWEFTEEAESSAALIWQLWYESLPEHLFERYLNVNVTNHLTRHQVITAAGGDEDGMLFAGLNEDYHVSFPKAARETFYEAVNRAEEEQGSNPESWEWGEFHTVGIDHPLGSVFPLNLLFNIGGWEMGGSGAVPGALSYDSATGQADHGAGWRFIGDLSSTESFYDVNIPGQSGQWLSPNYDNQMDTWVEGEYYPVIYDKSPDDGFDHVRFVPE
ncbi:penicillin acylase family protein [Alkalicoccus halolimnae]|uniref:Penicillin acylase family protein n=1 Tax=Alkalicoccus halolimnae TaxID=1667239 RepID=A0AAJ8N313_9BACI|nr:penicillin acylase family protein [Alkalicoccus halolimnae]